VVVEGAGSAPLIVSSLWAEAGDGPDRDLAVFADMLVVWYY
jgi:hypothetical protein